MLDSFIRGVTKDSYGPISFGGSVPVLIHKFHDSFSRFGWGKLPDVIRERGKQNAFLFAELNAAVQSSEAWKVFLRSPNALSFRKSASSIPHAAPPSASGSAHVSSALNELAETFPPRSNFVGVISEERFKNLKTNELLTREDFLTREVYLKAVASGDAPAPLLGSSQLPQNLGMLYPVSEYFNEEKIPVGSVLGRTVWDYTVWKKQTGCRVLPFEIHAHFSLTPNSLKKINTESLALPKTASLAALQTGTVWDFPLLEISLAGHPFEKRVSFSEVLMLTDYSPERLQTLLLQAAWISAFVREQMRSPQIKLNSVTLRFGETAKGEFELVDSLHMDDLDLEIGEQPLFQETDEHYLKTSWSQSVFRAQKQASQNGASDWKRLCVEPAPWLDVKVKSNLEQLHQKLHKELAHVCSDRNRI
jgi:hypothetical protein